MSETSARDLHVPLDPSSRTPLVHQIADGIVDAIRAGRVAPGARLPGSRTLATRLDVNRSTVCEAYDELAAQGWVESRAGSGTYACDLSATPEPAPTGRARALGFDLAPAPPPRRPWRDHRPDHTIRLVGGQPDPRLMPSDLLAHAYRRVLRSRHADTLLSYGDPRGVPRLRSALAATLSSRRGLDVDPERGLIVTRGSMMAISLIAHALIRPGDVVCVEALGYSPAWDALERAGATLAPIPVDDEGFDTRALAGHIARHGAPRAVYVTPHHQYPTTRPLSATRRAALLAIAAEHRIAILEDDYDNEFHFDGRPLLPLASQDTAGVVLYIGTLSKVLSPALRIGYVVAPEPLVERLADLRLTLDRQGDQIAEAAIAELVEDGDVGRHVRRTMRAYRGRRDHLVAALERHLGGVLDFESPAGGMSLWARVRDPSIDVDAWAREAERLGVTFTTGARYRFDGASSPHVRFGFAVSEPDEIEEGIARAASALSSTRRSP